MTIFSEEIGTNEWPLLLWYSTSVINKIPIVARSLLAPRVIHAMYSVSLYANWSFSVVWTGENEMCVMVRGHMLLFSTYSLINTSFWLRHFAIKST